MLTAVKSHPEKISLFLLLLQKQLVLVDIIRYNYNILWLECDYSAHQWFTEAVHGGLSRKAGRYGIYRWVRSQMSLLPQCAPGRSGCPRRLTSPRRRFSLSWTAAGTFRRGGALRRRTIAAARCSGIPASRRSMGFAVKLDTNGCHPEALADILRQGLADYVAMDIKNCREKYAGTVGVPDFDLAPVEESIQLLVPAAVWSLSSVPRWSGSSTPLRTSRPSADGWRVLPGISCKSL